MSECFQKLLEGPFAEDVLKKLKDNMPDGVPFNDEDAFKRVVVTRLPQAFMQQEREYTLQVLKLGCVNYRLCTRPCSHRNVCPRLMSQIVFLL